jgi:hypothetical protein
MGLALAMIPLGVALVALAGFVGTQVWPNGLGFALAALLGILGAYMPLAGVLLFVLLGLFWLPLFFNAKSIDDEHDA